MTLDHQPPKNISELVADLERIREELLTVQRDLEKMVPGTEKIGEYDAGKNTKT
jgi:hypothetical protein